MSTSRHLAAILFTDIVGYTALMGEDEHKAFQLLKANRQLQKPLIEEFHGQWIKEIGDGVLAIFASATDAVACACTILNQTYKVPGLQLRIGIHLGDIVLENGDAFGDGVNIAARLQALAPINGIWLSEAVFQNVFNKKGIEANFVKEETLKNVREPVRIYEVNFKSFSPQQFMSTTHDESTKSNPQSIFPGQVGLHQSLFSPKKNQPIRRRMIMRPAVMVSAVILIILASFAYILYGKWNKINIARNSWLPEIQRLAGENIKYYPKAYALAIKAEEYIPDDPTFKQVKSEVSSNFSMQTNPDGADVYWQDLYDSTGKWNFIGKSPVKNASCPQGFIRIKAEKPGFVSVYTVPIVWEREFNIRLDSIGKFPDNMVRVPGLIANLMIVGLDQYGGEGGHGRYVQEFLMDKYEVTNKEFKKFVDAGGYQNKTYWDHPIMDQGNQITWEKGMSLFHDETGKPGPSTWQLGSYPDGKENHPVTGISWYEAMAYAKFANKKLPTVYHWSQVANTVDTWTIIPRSNFSGTGTIPVGSKDNMSTWGVLDIAGNAREWCLNESQEKNQHFILGGGWNDPDYAYNDAFTQSALDRSRTNGFRCIKLSAGDTSYALLSQPMELASRDYSKEKPINDDEFKIYARQFSYDHTPLNAKIETILDSSSVRVEKIDMDATYNNEILSLYLYIPKNVSPPYQTIIIWPGSGDLGLKKFDPRVAFWWGSSFIMKSGRVLAYPILKSTWDRGDGMYSDLQNETNNYKEHVIWWTQDFRRCLDYLDTRKDIAQTGYGFYGISWGSAMGPVLCSVEPRIKAAVFHVGGLMQQKALPEVDPFNYASRVKIPVLMLNGRNDTFFPLDASQKPLFNLLGSGVGSKEMKIYEGGHLVPFSDLMKESVSWYDKWLGVVK